MPECDYGCCVAELPDRRGWRKAPVPKTTAVIPVAALIGIPRLERAALRAALGSCLLPRYSTLVCVLPFICGIRRPPAHNLPVDLFLGLPLLFSSLRSM